MLSWAIRRGEITPTPVALVVGTDNFVCMMQMAPRARLARQATSGVGLGDEEADLRDGPTVTENYRAFMEQRPRTRRRSLIEYT